MPSESDQRPSASGRSLLSRHGTLRRALEIAVVQLCGSSRRRLQAEKVTWL